MYRIQNKDVSELRKMLSHVIDDFHRRAGRRRRLSRFTARQRNAVADSAQRVDHRDEGGHRVAQSADGQG